MRCFAEKSVLAKQKKSSSGSRVFSSQATAANHCFKPHAAPGCGTAPACTNTSSDSIRNPQRIHPGIKFSLAETHGLFLTLWLACTYPDQKDPYLFCSVTANPRNKSWCQSGWNWYMGRNWNGKSINWRWYKMKVPFLYIGILFFPWTYLLREKTLPL